MIIYLYILYYLFTSKLSVEKDWGIPWRAIITSMRFYSLNQKYSRVCYILYTQYVTHRTFCVYYDMYLYNISGIFWDNVTRHLSKHTSLFMSLMVMNIINISDWHKQRVNPMVYKTEIIV